jgi:hypothetical protein
MFPIMVLVIGNAMEEVSDPKVVASIVDMSLIKASLINFDLLSYLFLETSLFMNVLRFSLTEKLIIGTFST